MDIADQFTTRIETYLSQLDNALGRWNSWLQLGESAGIALDRSLFATFEQRAPELTTSLQELTERRQGLLRAAAEAGLPAQSIQALAKSLPAWQRAEFRSTMKAMQVQLNHLRRLHVAAFILLHQSLQQSRDSLRLLSTGGAGQRTVYCGNDSLDSGGQLLDAAL